MPADGVPRKESRPALRLVSTASPEADFIAAESSIVYVPLSCCVGNEMRNVRSFPVSSGLRAMVNGPVIAPLGPVMPITSAPEIVVWSYVAIEGDIDRADGCVEHEVVGGLWIAGNVGADDVRAGHDQRNLRVIAKVIGGIVVACFAGNAIGVLIHLVAGIERHRRGVGDGANVIGDARANRIGIRADGAAGGEVHRELCVAEDARSVRAHDGAGSDRYNAEHGDIRASRRASCAGVAEGDGDLGDAESCRIDRAVEGDVEAACFGAAVSALRRLFSASPLSPTAPIVLVRIRGPAGIVSTLVRISLRLLP